MRRGRLSAYRGYVAGMVLNLRFGRRRIFPWRDLASGIRRRRLVVKDGAG